MVSLCFISDFHPFSPMFPFSTSWNYYTRFSLFVLIKEFPWGAERLRKSYSVLTSRSAARCDTKIFHSSAIFPNDYIYPMKLLELLEILCFFFQRVLKRKLKKNWLLRYGITHMIQMHKTISWRHMLNKRVALHSRKRLSHD